MNVDKLDASNLEDYLEKDKRQFKKLTLRLDDQERAMLDKVKSRYNIKSDNSFFRTVIKWLFHEGLK